MKKKLILVSLVILMLLVITGCEKSDNINQETNNLQEDELETNIPSNNEEETVVTENDEDLELNDTESTEETPKFDLIEKGYKYSNNENSGFAVDNKEFIFYSPVKEISGLYKINRNNGNIEKLNDSQCGYMNLIGNWIYYADITNDYNMYRYNIITDKRFKLTEHGVNNIFIDNKIIYYLSFENNLGYIKKMDLDGENKRKITQAKAFTRNENILVSRTGNFKTSELQIINIEENSKKRIDLGHPIGFILSYKNEHIYAILGIDDRFLCKISLDGETIEKLVEISYGSFNIMENNIYFIT